MIKTSFVRKFLLVPLLVITVFLLYYSFPVIYYDIHGPKIFFLETSEARKLTIRQACSVESAACHNPTMSILVLMTPSSSIDFSDHLVKILTSLPNVALQQMNVDVFVQGSPLEEWLRSGKLNLTQWKVHHLSDALRLLLIWKYGGMYMDLDIVTLRPLELPENSVILENRYSVSSAVLFFHSKHEFMRLCMEDLAMNYNPHIYAINGPLLVTKNLKKFCDVQDVGNTSGSECGVDVLAPETANPIPWDQWNEYLKPVQLNISISSHFPSSYMLHVWNKVSIDGKLVIGSNSLYERAMKEHCPLVYQHAQQFKEV